MTKCCPGRIPGHFGVQVKDLEELRTGTCRKSRCAPCGTIPGVQNPKTRAKIAKNVGFPGCPDRNYFVLIVNPGRWSLFFPNGLVWMVWRRELRRLGRRQQRATHSTRYLFDPFLKAGNSQVSFAPVCSSCLCVYSYLIYFQT